MDEMFTIGEAAERIGVEPHVLRHWEQVGALSPQRDSAGRRTYSDQNVDEALIVRRLQRVGFSLEELAMMGSASARSERHARLDERAEALRSRVSDFLDAIDYLEHVKKCAHPIVAECPECAAFISELDFESAASRRRFGRPGIRGARRQT